MLYFLPPLVTSSAAEPHDLHMIDPVVDIDEMSPIILSAAFDLQGSLLVVDVPSSDFHLYQRQQAVAFFTAGDREYSEINKAAGI